MRIIKYIERYWHKRYYRLFGTVGEGSLIPLKDFKNISGKEFIFVGRYCSIGPGCNINACKDGNVIIKDGTIVAPNVTILSRNHNFRHDLQKIPYDDVYHASDVVIEEAVWIGQNVTILPGVHIGRGAVVGAGGVVSKSIPECAICVGNPAKIIGYRDKEEFYNLLEKESFSNRFRGEKKYYKLPQKSFME